MAPSAQTSETTTLLQKAGYKTSKATERRAPEKPYTYIIDSNPLTENRLPYIPAPDTKLIDAGTPRANIAPSPEHPNGTQPWSGDRPDQTVLQQHAAYFDKDGDGIIWPIDTWRGVRAWGWNPLLSAIAVYLINCGLSYPTGDSLLPDPMFRIHTARLHKDHHGSSSGTYDSSGRYRPQMFEEIWTKYDRDGKDGMTVYEMWEAHKGQRMAFDFFGWWATFLEWLASYLLIWPEDGVLRKEPMRKIFDGSIFQEKADEYARKQMNKGKMA